jgi:cobalt-zinc-cadmium efflux system membrane fusion protein
LSAHLKSRHGLGRSMGSDKKTMISDLVVGGALLIILLAAYLIGGFGGAQGPQSEILRMTADATAIGSPVTTTGAGQSLGNLPKRQIVTLSDQQLAEVKVEPVRYQAFPIEKSAVGNIDFNQYMSVQVFTPYQGRIIEPFAKVGDDVMMGQPLFTIDSPDLLQAESTLISAAGTLELHTRTLARARDLYKTQAIAQRELEQAVSDQQSAEGALKAARDAVRIFGKSDTAIDRIVADRRIDSSLIVPSPISGRITARNAAPGLFVQPGNAPAPYSVTDISTMWLVANVPESDSPELRIGQSIRATIMAFPDRIYEGKITTIGAAVDPNTHRLFVRSEINDPQQELRPGMFATFVIETAEPARALAVPFDGVVREGDGTMTVWVTKDRHHFERRTVRIGLQRDGYDQILDGLQRGELIASEGALFLSNFFAAASAG